MSRPTEPGERGFDALQPEDEAELRELLRDARARQQKCIPVGNDSRAGYGAPIHSSTRRISMRRMRGVTRFEAEDLTCGVLVGTPWAELLACVEERKLTVDAGPFAACETRSVGGIFGEAPPNSRGFDRASLRSHLLGMRAIDGRDRCFHSGGKVVKNVAGYDLCKLFVGGGGARFVATELQLRLVPLPEACALLRSDALDRSDAAALWLRTRREARELRACDLVFDGGGSAHVEALVAGPRALVRKLAKLDGFTLLAEDHDAWRAAPSKRERDYEARGHIAASQLLEAISAFAPDATARISFQGATSYGASAELRAALPSRCFLHCIRGPEHAYRTSPSARIDARIAASFGELLAPERSSFDCMSGPTQAP